VCVSNLLIFYLFSGEDQVLRASYQEEGGSDQAVGGPQDRAGLPSRGQGHRRRRLQALKDPRRAQVHRQGLHRHAPEAEGEPQETVQGKNNFFRGELKRFLVL
jgi:hypothetical protein